MAKEFNKDSGKSFKIILGDGKAPYKLLFLESDGTEFRRTHHKRLDLAFARAELYNPNWKIVDATK